MRARTVANREFFFSPKLYGFFLFSILLIVMLLLTKSADCAQLRVEWDANVDSVTKGYKVYYGTKSGAYDSSIDVGNTISYKIDALQAGTIYYLAATAYDSNGNESDVSEELVVNTPSEPADPVIPVDSDSDGISDDDETSVYGTNPYNDDTDGDGIKDGAELQLWGSNWNKDDDGDGIINLLDSTPYPQVTKKKVNMAAILTLLLD